MLNISNNTALQIPLVLNAENLLHDLKICEDFTWQNHFNHRDYSGSWTSISLRSVTGKETDILAHAADNYTDTELLKKCMYFQKILNGLRFDKETVRLLCLAPGSEIKEHSDPHLGYEFGFFRLHIPIITDDQVLFRVGGTDLKMNAGECWYANFHLPHSVQHKGTKNRIHLVIDGIRNEWTDELFAKSGYDFEAEQISRKPNRETLQQMIAELALQNTETSRQLMLQLEQELAAS